MGSRAAGVIIHLPETKLPARHWFPKNYAGLVFPPEGIVEVSVPTREFIDNGPNESGLYFLLRRGRICYVGKSQCLYSRVYQHHCAQRPFDAVAAISGIPVDAMDAVENSYRLGWDPPWNVARTRGYFDGSKAMVAMLAAMLPSPLICDEPE